MFPLLFRTDLGFVYTFTVVWLVGLMFAAWMIFRQSPRLKGWDGFLAAAVGALAVGRLQFVWQNSEWFAENPAVRWSWQQGGHGYAGAVLGALLALFIWSKSTNSPLQKQLAVLAPAVPLLHFVGWLACYFDGCGYGAQAFIGWATAELPDNFGLMAVRYQTQLLGMAIALIVGAPFWVPLFKKTTSDSTNKSPIIFWGLLLILASTNAIITTWQGNTVPLLFDYRSDMILALAIAAVAFIAIVLNGTRNLGQQNQMG